jgi:hypothetical protein
MWRGGRRPCLGLAEGDKPKQETQRPAAKGQPDAFAAATRIKLLTATSACRNGALEIRDGEPRPEVYGGELRMLGSQRQAEMLKGPPAAIRIKLPKPRGDAPDLAPEGRGGGRDECLRFAAAAETRA